MASSPYMASGFLRYLGPPALAIWDWSDGSHVDLLALVTAPDTWQDPSSAQSFDGHSAPPIRAVIRLFLLPASAAGHLFALLFQAVSPPSSGGCVVSLLPLVRPVDPCGGSAEAQPLLFRFYPGRLTAGTPWRLRFGSLAAMLTYRLR